MSCERDHQSATPVEPGPIAASMAAAERVVDHASKALAVIQDREKRVKLRDAIYAYHAVRDSARGSGKHDVTGGPSETPDAPCGSKEA